MSTLVPARVATIRANAQHIRSMRPKLVHHRLQRYRCARGEMVATLKAQATEGKGEGGGGEGRAREPHVAGGQDGARGPTAGSVSRRCAQ